MKIRHFATAVALAALSILFVSVPASAQATRTWVSGVGDDANPCSRTAPCKTFAGAISKTAAGGEINALDSGGFGAVTITKSITISSEGNVAGVLVGGTNGIIVNAGANDVVVLRGLDLEGLGTGINGINFLAGAALTVDNCRIRNFLAIGGNGINLETAGVSELYVTNTSISHSGGGAGTAGIKVKPIGSGFARVTIVNSDITNNSMGVRLVSTTTTGGVVAAISDTNISGNERNGIQVVATTGVGVNAMVDHAVVANNGIGAGGAAMWAEGSGATIRISNSNITGNEIGLLTASGAKILTYGNNHIDGNTTDGAPTGTIAER